MIRDLSSTLQAILSDPSLAVPFPELSKALIAFDRPDDNFKPAQTTVDLFLFDVRENMELRSNEPKIERLNGQAKIHKAPMRVSCSYLVTAWPVGGTDLALQEQRLLTQVLQVLSTYPKIPASFLKGKLVGQEPDLPMMASHPEELQNPAEFWTAIGNKLRPSITVTVTLGIEIFPPITATIAKTELVRLGGADSGRRADARPGYQDGVLPHWRKGDQQRKCGCRSNGGGGWGSPVSAHGWRRGIRPGGHGGGRIHVECAIEWYDQASQYYGPSNSGQQLRCAVIKKRVLRGGKHATVSIAGCLC